MGYLLSDHSKRQIKFKWYLSSTAWRRQETAIKMLPIKSRTHQTTVKSTAEKMKRLLSCKKGFSLTFSFYICFTLCLSLSLITVRSVLYKCKDLRKASSLHSIWSLLSLSKLLHYSCPSHWRPVRCCIQGFPFDFKHFNATLIHHIMYLSDTYSWECEWTHIWSFLPVGKSTHHRPTVMKHHHVYTFSSKYLHLF